MDAQRLSEDAARALLRTRVGDWPDGPEFRLVEVRRLLWRGFCVDNGWPYAGGSFLVTPDARLWSVSSNPGIHDSDLAEDLLERAFFEGIGERLDQEMFSARLGDMTEQRQVAIREFFADLRGGDLRGQSERKLP